MIIYGSRATQIGKEQLFDQCPHCRQNNVLTIYVYRRFAHVFWIPFFPIGKTGYSECSHCKLVLKKEEMPDAINQAYFTLAKQSKTPWWMFAGLGVITTLIAVSIVNGQVQDARNKKWVLDPHKGDVYTVKEGLNSYTLLKITAVTGDSVSVQSNMYESNRESGVDQLKDKPYSEIPFTISRQQLKTMLDEGGILDIDR